MGALRLAVFTTSFLCDGPTAVAYAEEALALARELDDPIAVGRAQFGLGMAWAFSGDAVRAAAPYREALSLLREGDSTSWAATVLAEVGDNRLLTGDVAGAVPLLDEALVLYQKVGHPVGTGLVLGERGHAALLQGDHVLAAHLFAESIAVSEAIGAERNSMGAVAGMAGVALALGQPERAARLLGAVVVAGETSGVGRIAHTSHTERIAAEVRAGLAEPAFATAWDEGRSLPIVDAVSDALAIASSAGEQRQLVHRDVATGLTQREHDVLRLLVQGLSDRQIAEELFIGARTVQTHVANVFTKLGVNTRAEAAAVAVRRARLSETDSP